MQLVGEIWSWDDAEATRRRERAATSQTMANEAGDGSALPRPALGPSDEALMAKYRRGDDAAFAQLYARHRASLARFVRRMSPDVRDCEEVLQETWMAIVRGRDSYAPDAKFSTYLFSIARRRTMDRWRRRGRSPEAEPQADDAAYLAAPSHLDTEQLAHATALGDALQAAIDKLPLLQREAFLMRAEGGLSVEDIALATGVTHETAKSRLRYAMARLRRALESWT
jgi:RNA polymerase sigma factor (sigma-70 family)